MESGSRASGQARGSTTASSDSTIHSSCIRGNKTGIACSAQRTDLIQTQMIEQVLTTTQLFSSSASSPPILVVFSSRLTQWCPRIVVKHDVRCQWTFQDVWLPQMDTSADQICGTV
jgi:hypothetical protein